MAITRKRERKNSDLNANNFNILLIEDQLSVASMTASMLTERLDCHVLIAKSYAETKEILATEKDNIFLAVSDLNLPGSNNGEIIDLLRENDQSIVAITGYFNQDIHQELIHKGVIDYVLKKNIHAYDYLVNLVGRLFLNQFNKVLVIDDSQSMQQVIGSYLNRNFLNVIYADNGKEGLSLLEKHSDVKLVLVDAEMPVMDGLTFTAKARQIKNQNNLCIIGISCSEQKDLSTQFLKHGANDFISKPFSYDEIACRVNQNLRMLTYIEDINKIAHFDFLTQLPNRRSFFKQSKRIIDHAIKYKQHLVVAMMDIDFFKGINDTYGHDCGDAVLQHIAQIMRDMLGDHLFARLGGEEFGLVIEGKNYSESNQLLSAFLQAVEKSIVNFQGHELKVTISIGATYSFKKNIDDALKIADEHLYQAKKSGRNKIVWNYEKPVVDIYNNLDKVS